jgi:protein TonB
MRRDESEASLISSGFAAIKSFIFNLISIITLVFPRSLSWPGLCTPASASFGTGGIVSRRTTAAWLTALTMAVSVGPSISGAQNAQSDEITRRAKTKVQPLYPDLAKKMSISGTVKIEIVVAPNGTVKDARVVGGHPVLANAALDAAKKWRFEPAAAESSGIIDFKFEPR